VTDYSDLVARARGLSGHLLRNDQLTALCACSAAELAGQLVSVGAIAADRAARDDRSPLDAYAIERALRDRATERLRILARWSGDRHAVLAALLDEEDLRSLRALVRTINVEMSPEEREVGLIPTPTLPLRALRALSRAADVANFASLLLTWQSPYGAALAVEAARGRPELLRIEVALARVFAERARSATRFDRMLRRYVERVIDQANLWTALVLAEHSTDSETSLLFIQGGVLMRPEDLDFARTAASRDVIADRLRPRLAGTALASALDVGISRDVADLTLDALVREFEVLARTEPTSVAPIIAFVLRQRAELRTLLRIVWSAQLGIPAALIRRSAGLAA
jgi:vacuolar-type H+-ATPase subunit C/Vma6